MRLRRLIGDFIRKRNPLDIEQIEIPVKAKSSLRIAHVSDVHIPRCAFSPREIADSVQKQMPDVIFLTGDVMDRRTHFCAPRISLLLALLLEIAPVYAISGNHERGNSEYYKIWETMLTLRGVHFVDEKVARFEKAGTTFVIVGMRDINLKRDLVYDFSFLSEITVADDECYLLLHHRPSIWRDVYPPDAPMPEVVFSGHAHGGQIRIPFTNRGLVAPNQGLFPKYTSGLYRHPRGSYEVVSRGLASVTNPIRINNRPHIPIVELISNNFEE